MNTPLFYLHLASYGDGFISKAVSRQAGNKHSWLHGALVMIRIRRLDSMTLGTVIIRPTDRAYYVP